MLVMILGIIVFLGVHTLTTARQFRADLIARLGPGPFKGLYSGAAGIGLILIIWGFSRYQAEGLIPLWSPPSGARPVTLVLMWLAFVALACASPAPSRISGWMRHPMLVGVMLWALAHLLVNGDLGGVLLFGSFLVWAIYDRIAVSRRGDLGAPQVASFTRADLIAVVAGTVAYVLMIFLHPVLIGVSVFNG